MVNATMRASQMAATSCHKSSCGSLWQPSLAHNARHASEPCGIYFRLGRLLIALTLRASSHQRQPCVVSSQRQQALSLYRRLLRAARQWQGSAEVPGGSGGVAELVGAVEERLLVAAAATADPPARRLPAAIAASRPLHA